MAGLTGTMYAWSVFSGPLGQAHGWSSSEVSLAYSIYSLCVCLASLLAGWLQRKVDSRAIAVFGGLLLTVAWVALGLLDSLAVLYVCFGVFSGLGCGSMYNVSITCATKWYADKKGFANGLCIGFVGLTPLVLAPFSGFMMSTFGLTIACFSFAGVSLACAVLFGWLVSMPKVGTDVACAGPAGAASGKKPAEMAKTALFWAMLAAFFFIAFAGAMVVGHAASIGAAQAGFDAAQGSLLVALLAVGNFAGRFGFGMLSDKLGRCETLFVSLFITLAVLLLVLPSCTSGVVLELALMAIGASYGAVLVVMPSLCSDVFGERYFGQNYSYLFVGFSLALCAGPLVGGMVVDAVGSYVPAYFISAACAAVGVVLVFAISRLSRKNR